MGQTLGRAADTTPNFEWSVVRSVSPSCVQVDADESRHTIWVVLSTDGDVVLLCNALRVSGPRVADWQVLGNN